MYSLTEARLALEGLHLDYLCKAFPYLRRVEYGDFDNGLVPDLVGIGPGGDMASRRFFEMKSRVFPFEQSSERKRPISDYRQWKI